MKKYLAIGLSVLMMAALLCGCTGNKSEGRVFKHGFDLDYPPYSYIDDNGEVGGFDVELCKALCEYKGWTYEAVPFNWDAKDAELNAGNCDCIWSGFTKNGREDDYAWSICYSDNTQMIMVPDGSDINTLEDLAGKRVGVQTATSAYDLLQDSEEGQGELCATFEKLEVYDRIMINVDSMDNVTSVQAKIEELGFRTESEMQYIEQSMKTSNMLQGVLGAIGAVSFLVAAINITNTMIMSIYERTKEIGIMKVLGCYIRDVKRLFLFEAGIIGFIGGTLGVAFSYLAAWAINKYGGAFLGSLFGEAEEGMKFCMIPGYLPLLSIVGAVVVGVLSGYMPAARATKISAIEAMKNEG